MEIVDVIESVGFPIVACVFLFFQNRDLTRAIGDLSSTLNNIDKRLEAVEKKMN